MQNLVWHYDKGLPELPANVTGVIVKSSDGVNWLADAREFPGPLDIKGPREVDEWRERIGQRELWLWSVPKGSGNPFEAERIIQACLRPSVKGMVLDIEPFSGFWQGGREAVKPFMEHVRRALPPDFHIGISVDPRRQHYASIFSDEWREYIDSLHPQCYWRTFGQTPLDTINSMYLVWGDYGVPIYPVLQGNAPQEEREYAADITRRAYGAKGISWWRIGVMSLEGLP